MDRVAIGTTTRSGVRACLVWVGVFALLSFLGSASADPEVTTPWYKINYNTPAYVLYKPQDVAQYASSRSAANGYCMQNGMSIFSAELPVKDEVFASDAAKELGGAGYFTYTGSSAEPVPSFARQCTERQPSELQLPHSGKCGFTFRFGLLTITDTVLLDYQPGVAQYFSLYPGLSGAGNAYTGYPVEWDTTNSNPRGYYFMAVTGLTDTVGRHVNVDATVSSTDPYVNVAKFAIYCESQSFLGYLPVPRVVVQPRFVKGYKDLTWAQEHWWVIFLIVATVILMVLIFIMTYCCLTMAPPKEEPPIAPMVLREREGAAYVNVFNGKASSKPRTAANVSDQHRSMPTNLHHECEILPGSLLAADPEDLIQATPSIYVQEETLLTADADSRASENEDE